jgi:8-oxo-dGTP pyrophosphatase MutT (NUDIX family)
MHKAVARNPWKTRSSRIVYENHWVRVREDEVIRPDGGPGIYGVIEVRPSAGIVAINERDEVVLVGQWRYSVNRYSWEIPRGGSHPGESDILEVAKRELAEEAGVLAERWKRLASVDNCNGVADDTQTLYLATGLSSTAMNHDPEEEITVRWYPFEEALQMAMDGRITEVCSVAALLHIAILRNGGRPDGLVEQ